MRAAFTRILVPIDFVDGADTTLYSGCEIDTEGNTVAVASASIRALELAASIVGPDGQVYLLHVTPSYDAARVYGATGAGILGSVDIDAVHEGAREASTVVLDALVERYTPQLRRNLIVRPGTALRVILEEARRIDAELLVLAASGRGRVARFFLGSTADRVIRESPCPVMVIPADREEPPR